MFKSYKLGWTAEKLCSQLFKESSTNDESDACRHFIWSALLYKEYGLDFSTTVLNAHEQDLRQPTQEKAMDLANNRLGQLSAQSLIKKNRFNDQEVLKSFKENWKKENLIILRELHRGKK